MILNSMKNAILRLIGNKKYMVKKYSTYKRKIDNIMSNNLNNVDNLYNEIVNLVNNAHDELDNVHKQPNESDKILADSRYRNMYCYVKSVIGKSQLQNKQDILLYLECMN